MFVIELHETQVYVNGFKVVDLKKPFHRIVVHEGKRIDDILRTPSESLSRQRKPLTYYVKFSDKKAGALFNSEVTGCKCHWIYNTNPAISPLFRDKALLTLLRMLDIAEIAEYAEIRRYLSTILRFLWKSFPFDCVVTSLRTVPLLLPDVPVIVMPLQLVSLPKETSFCGSRYKTLAAVLKGHEGGVPLSLLTAASFKFLGLRHTTFDRHLLKGQKNILIIEGTNTSYAGFLARELAYLPGTREILPCTLFHINT